MENHGERLAELLLDSLLRKVAHFRFSFAHAGYSAARSRARQALAELAGAATPASAKSEPKAMSFLQGVAAEANEVLDTFRMIAQLKKSHAPGAVQAYVISGSESENDVFAMLRLASICGVQLAATEDDPGTDAGAAIRIHRFIRSASETMRRVWTRRSTSVCSIPGAAVRKSCLDIRIRTKMAGC